MKTLLFFILLIHLSTILHCQKKDTTYKYLVCIHKQSDFKTLFKSTNIKNKDTASKTGYFFSLSLSDKNKIPIKSSAIVLYKHVIDTVLTIYSGLRVIQEKLLDTTNKWTFSDLSAGIYDIKIGSVGFVTQTITKIELKNNNSLIMDFNLGNSNSFITMELLSKRKLNSRQLQKSIRHLEKENNR